MKKIYAIGLLYILMMGCDSLENNDSEKLAATIKMKEKINKISKELKAYCDSEIYRKAKFKADSIGQKFVQFKGVR